MIKNIFQKISKLFILILLFTITFKRKFQFLIIEKYLILLLIFYFIKESSTKKRKFNLPELMLFSFISITLSFLFPNALVDKITNILRNFYFLVLFLETYLFFQIAYKERESVVNVTMSLPLAFVSIYMLFHILNANNFAPFYNSLFWSVVSIFSVTNLFLIFKEPNCRQMCILFYLLFNITLINNFNVLFSIFSRIVVFYLNYYDDYKYSKSLILLVSLISYCKLNSNEDIERWLNVYMITGLNLLITFHQILN